MGLALAGQSVFVFFQLRQVRQVRWKFQLGKIWKVWRLQLRQVGQVRWKFQLFIVQRRSPSPRRTLGLGWQQQQLLLQLQRKVR